jgi:hypothetical protein
VAASGVARDDADIDIAVAKNATPEPATFDEKLDLKVAVRDAVCGISEEIPIDLVAYTTRESEQLKKADAPFVRGVLKGQVLHEKTG